MNESGNLLFIVQKRGTFFRANSVNEAASNRIIYLKSRGNLFMMVKILEAIAGIYFFIQVFVKEIKVIQGEGDCIM